MPHAKQTTMPNKSCTMAPIAVHQSGWSSSQNVRGKSNDMGDHPLIQVNVVYFWEISRPDNE
jgi:hypothetical protein